MRLLHKPIPLDAPKQPGEVEYTTLQLSRLRHTAINFQRIVIASLVFFLAAGAVSTTAVVIVLSNRDHDQCVSSNNSRAAIKRAVEGVYDGFIKVSHGDPQAVQFKKDYFTPLTKDLPQRQC